MSGATCNGVCALFRVGHQRWPVDALRRHHQPADPAAEGVPGGAGHAENGGEPTIHLCFTGIVQALRSAGMQAGSCTNATTLIDTQICELAGIGGVHAAVSLDGFRADSHGRSRGDRGGLPRPMRAGTLAIRV